ncbi:MAG: FtsB family cell division protein [Acidimicrobiales bacterium]
MSTTAVMVIAVLFVFVFPTRTYLSQRSHLVRVSSALASLDAQNQALADEVAKLNTETAIERLARQDYGLVPPGQEAYAMLPSASGSATGHPNSVPGIVHPEIPLGVEPHATPGTPTAKATPSHRGFFDRILHRLGAWL